MTHQSSRAGRPDQFRLQRLYYTPLTSHQEPEGLISSGYSDCTIHHSPVIESRKACSVLVTVTVLCITHQSSRAGRPDQFRLQGLYYASLTSHREPEGLIKGQGEVPVAAYRVLGGDQLGMQRFEEAVHHGPLVLRCHGIGGQTEVGTELHLIRLRTARHGERRGCSRYHYSPREKDCMFKVSRSCRYVQV